MTLQILSEVFIHAGITDFRKRTVCLGGKSAPSWQRLPMKYPPKQLADMYVKEIPTSPIAFLASILSSKVTLQGSMALLMSAGSIPNSEGRNLYKNHASVVF
ncbi:hypothetical protein MLD38_037770 [Melastoma candidum]|uniref:Uncharacterized protein n=1 Tax=Melastoma candidum TaxID=119954 RepID=A0ACB9LP03_9MYRT|nr:hypothetical protein MLD38_037770 [Melastoma candidum]